MNTDRRCFLKGVFGAGAIAAAGATARAAEPSGDLPVPPGAEFAGMGQAVRIPHNDKIDSLNLSIAVGIGAYAFVHAK